ncbi:uncharacterized protein A1O9_12378 [Exophiala aquamarina CBS 119918]|uniref:Transcription factor domain-containing protein n=1 Tax=Exophiala aquamarina CBS 119918 TaxID=1182545 RepID=A0A072NV17_9EURO|nr:uncharacterized protein A1O9_12378 [Exophiala aquamarina CBS 119918]KEF51461.1 hypothetical protein A1O9_12378 [Exophiala aquamarina CBS 119918]
MGPADLFDYASFLWDDPNPLSLPDFSVGPRNLPGVSNSLEIDSRAFVSSAFGKPLQLPDAGQLIDHFKQSDPPPILAPIETPARWSFMRNHLVSMANTSQMVHQAILAFSSLQIQRQTDRLESDFSSYYTRCQEEITKCLIEHDGEVEIVGARVQHVLAALFLLSYIDLVANRTNFAHVNLRKAFMIVSNSEQETWDFAEKRIVVWIRLVDARAVSAGGEGLFLREEDENHETSRSMSPVERDAENVLFDILSQPPLRFFQKTQSFMGRISKIDLWHRSRGTVSDETEVMAIAAKIQIDNQKLYRHRHPFMDLAVNGKLEGPLLASSLAERITMISRLALANHHATFIHLHRVAYRHLPRTVEVTNAMSMIRKLTRDMLDAQGPNDSLPVNMLWPLLMWGSEEENPEERVWVLSAIRGISKSISNAGLTADVLQNVWKKQDEIGQRADIRTVMHATFDSCFAIV